MTGRESLFPFPENAHRQMQYEAIVAALAPGERIPYTDLLDRLHAAGASTAGVGLTLDALSFRSRTMLWQRSDVISYRTPFFDHENEGTWTEGTLWITRKEDAVDE